MALEIRKTNGTLLATLEDGTADNTSSSLTLVGRRFAEFGKQFNENWVLTLENSNAQIPPLSPMIGQLWFDSTPGVNGLKVWISPTVGWQILAFSIDDSVASTFANDMTFNGDLTFGGTTTFNNLSTFASGTTFSSTATFDAAVTFNSSITFGAITFTGDATFTSDAAFSQTATFNGQTIFNSSTSFTGPITFDNVVTFSNNVTVTGGTIDGTVVGGGTAAAGTFTTLTASSTITFTSGTIDNVTIGGVTPSSSAFTSTDIDGGSIDATTIGAAVPAAGTFTDLIATGGTLDSVTVGVTTPDIGAFTDLTATNFFVDQPAPTAKTVTDTLTAAELLGRIITVNQGAASTSTLTLPLGTAIETALGTNAVTDNSFEFSLINISTVAAEDALLAVNTGVTIIGNLNVASNATATDPSVGRFLVRRAAADTYIVYRIG